MHYISVDVDPEILERVEVQVKDLGQHLLTFGEIGFAGEGFKLCRCFPSEAATDELIDQWVLETKVAIAALIQNPNIPMYNNENPTFDFVTTVNFLGYRIYTVFIVDNCSNYMRVLVSDMPAEIRGLTKYH